MVSNAWDSNEWQKGTRETLRAIIERLDQGVGQVLETLNDTGRADDTLVIFCSDNGAYPIAASNAPFRGYASELLEGGIHVACIARWPGKLPANCVDNRLAATFDLTKSILAAAGAVGPEDRPLDGRDILGEIAAGKPAEPRTLFWRARRGERTWRAVRDGDMKFVSSTDSGTYQEWLYDLSTDSAEQQDLLQSEPVVTKRIKSLLKDWEQDVQPLRKRPLSAEPR
ncbi:MAG: sulfatase-like hydrolase/transferase [Planctomycetia bacterium]|nr:sulfatase-like hydrolase/transferase [Planctomycetia bacterium]